jgi:tetratricopeptide (TPR) repeat protein
MSFYYKPRKFGRLPRLSRGLIFSVAVLTLVVGAAVDALNRRAPIGEPTTPITSAPQVAEPIRVSAFMQYYALGQAAYEKGEYLEAWLNFGDALIQGRMVGDVNTATVYYMRGQAAERMNLFESALTDYSMAGNYYGDAAARLRFENLDARLREMQEMVGDTVYYNNDDAYTLTQAGRLALQRQDYQEAIRMFSKALNVQPYNSHLYNLRAYTYHLAPSHNHTKALADYERAIELDASDAYAHMGKGYALAGLGRYAESFRSFETAVTLEPDYYGTYIAWGLAYQRMGDDANAGEMFWRWMDRPSAEYVEISTDSDVAHLSMSEGRVYLLSINAHAGQTLNVMAGVDNPYSLDSMLVLLDPSGKPVAGNDERIIDEDFNSAITDFAVTSDGTYTLAISHAGVGSYGEMRVEYSLDETTSSFAQTSSYYGDADYDYDYGEGRGCGSD